MNYLLASGILIPVVGVLVFAWRMRIELQAARARVGIRADENAVDALARPIAILEAELRKRETELLEMRREDKAERDQYVKTLAAMQTALEAIAKDLSSLRTEDRERAHTLHQRLDGMDDRLLVIETRLGGQ